ncbi:hypothetical protein A3A84_01195 [Candidatus Collierbacteria bacterium RIFCSPLOWO2_01_FULL_50_23]|uniref:Uncharacterized protein n=1 Tax=Candidatus Collierbacteria bacterium RIFCSPHIGHO2_01_FULL_50_25 TaxID=1817722 RepID=A0A1F5EYC2_9BACT|nr:MAG: hypothetical protein A2703_00275 [Candidatus Collierbacteria bacterium RIFCSPHIGHO2_01_FULL_50_25]OGD74274.1 MAG: hypothetical protein A3A84_01195 [Candidatus Collierbacteria bacterium RIFCSPLOWO2_01_FULL_50_23]
MIRYYYVDDKTPIRTPEEVEPGISRLIQLAVEHGFDPEWLVENNVENHEKAHALAYFRLTLDQAPYVLMGVSLNDDGSPRSIFVEIPVQDSEIELRICCAPENMSWSDREGVKFHLRRIRQRER